ncbi:glycoside hydrolase family 6 protein [Pseudonocardia spirodelae]|uniref:Glucanase n=1 Tax=Pseudonocardia spirodelae TaxID=3133431 RepID=A0ABU8T2R3_9PSEU
MRTLLAVVSGALAAAVVLVSCGSGVAPPGAAPATAPPSPTGYFVDPTSAAAAQVAQWRAEGRDDDAAQIEKIAAQPFPHWVTGDVAAAQADTKDYVDRARAAGATPLLVAYNVPHRDCGSFSGGGAPDGGYYRNWVTEIVRGLGGGPATVVLEPDAVPHELSGCVDGALRDERYQLLSDAVTALKGAGATVYVDAGNPGFISDVGALADALGRSGVGRADGFALNVANFYPTPEVVAFGERISDVLGGTHFVVDTSRNGRGVADEASLGGVPAFCNPPGRGLGAAPTTDTGSPRVDALLWVKRPGESDGACRPGEPAAGQWYPEYALGLAQRQAG